MPKKTTKKPRKVKSLAAVAKEMRTNNGEMIKATERLIERIVDIPLPPPDIEPLLIWEFGKNANELLIHQHEVLEGLKNHWPERKTATIANLAFILKKEAKVETDVEHLEILLPTMAYKISYGVWKLRGT